jgi:F-type H+-transporting ATPase subunit alpha
MEEQVAVIFAGTRGYLDALPVAAIGKYEASLLTSLHQEKSILSAIGAEKAISPDNEKKLAAFLDKFAKGFAA